MASNPARRRSAALCDLYLPGHDLHFIQIKKCIEHGSFVAGTLRSVQGLDLIVEVPNGVRTYRTHRTSWLKRVIRVGGPVYVDERYRILRNAPRGTNGTAWCIALPEDEWRPCSFKGLREGSPEALADRLEQRGGFVVAGQAIIGLEGQ